MSGSATAFEGPTVAAYPAAKIPALAPGAHDATPALPPVLASIRRRRLRMLALLALFAFGLGTFLTVVIPRLTTPVQALSLPMLLLCGGMSAVAIALLVALRGASLSERQTLTIGQIFVIIAAAAMAVTEVMVVPPKHQEISGVSGICLWIVMAPLVLLASPMQTMVTAFIAATWLPLFYGLSPYRSSYSPGHLLEWFVPGYFCAGLATVASRSINRLGKDLETAREKLREWSGYRLVHQLAVGGMGEIWLARHRLLPQAAAIKFIIPGQMMRNKDGDPDPRATDYQQFADEARAIASLTSPHTVRVYDFGLADDGRLFLVMEYLHGRDVEALVLRGSSIGCCMPQARVVHLLQQTCLALEEVHQAGLVHRDIKPSNIMVCRLGGEVDFVKLIDFGLTNEGENEDGDTVSGTPGFLAPELLLGTAGPSAASDLYALGATAWFMLTGSDIFDLDDGTWSTKHIADKPPLAELEATGADPELQQLILQLLAKHPQKRPQSAQGVRHILRNIAQRQPWSEEDALSQWQNDEPAHVGAKPTPPEARSITVLAR